MNNLKKKHLGMFYDKMKPINKLGMFDNPNYFIINTRTP